MQLATIHRVTPELTEEIKQPLVSVVIVCYNQACYLGQAIESALAQTHCPLEVLVVDDGSTDDTSAIAGSYPKVRYVRQTNRGLAAARNTGLRHCTGEYVAFLDADDRLLPRAIQAGVSCMQQAPDCGFVFGAYRNIYSDGSPAPADPPPSIDHDHYWNLLQGNFIGMHAAVLYRWEVLQALGGFNERLAACEDYDLYLRAARKCEVKRHLEVVAEYRQHDTNMSKDRAFMLRSALRVLKMHRRSLPDRRHRKALRSGMRVWRDYYGSLLFEDWKQNRTLAGLLPILRLNPRLLAHAFMRAVSRLAPTSRRVDFGSLRRTEPLSRRFGFDRGQPIDRYYIESFLAANAAAIRGRVLEIGDDHYSRTFGGDRIARQDVLHVAAERPGVTITADLSRAPHIPEATFDCIVLTQTLHYIFDLKAAVATVRRILKPGGVVLATLPGISQTCRDQDDKESDCWRFTESSARRLFTECFGAENVRLETRGNVLAATAFLQGLCVQDLTAEKLDRRDPDYPLTITVIAIKPKGES